MSIFNSIIIGLSTLGRFWQEKINSQIFRWNILFVASQLMLLIIKFNDLPRLVPLFYSLPWGGSQLAPASFLFFVPIFSIIIAVVNSLLAVFLLESVKFFSRLLLIFSLLFSLLSLVTLFQIIKLVG